MTLLRTRALALLTLLLCITTNMQAKEREQMKIYAFGFAASFSDSIVHFTDIQTIEGAWIQKKGKMLLERDEYSNQLRTYLTEHNQKNRTCIISFSTKLKDAEKKLVKMKKRYNAEKHYEVRYIPTSDFSFQAVEPITPEKKPLTKAERKAKKKEMKLQKKKNKQEKKLRKKEQKLNNKAKRKEFKDNKTSKKAGKTKKTDNSK